MSRTWERCIADEEDSAEWACFTTAVENGHTKEEANLCDNGSVGCPNCPFSQEAINERKSPLSQG